MKMNYVVLWKVCVLVGLIGVYGVGAERVSVMEGDSVTLHTDVTTNQQEKMKWFFNDTRIAEINGIMRYICTDVQCKDGDERFRDRLKLDNQTGSLTIMNITTTDSGDYHLEIINSGSDSEKTFSVTVHGVSAAGRDKMKGTSVKEGESGKVITWYFNDTAEITGDPRYSIYVKTAMGDYVEVIYIKKDSGLSSAAVAGICVGAVLLTGAAAAAAGGIYYRQHRQTGQYRTGTRTQHSNQENAPPLILLTIDRNLLLLSRPKMKMRIPVRNHVEVESRWQVQL